MSQHVTASGCPCLELGLLRVSPSRTRSGATYTMSTWSHVKACQSIKSCARASLPGVSLKMSDLFQSFHVSTVPMYQWVVSCWSNCHLWRTGSDPFLSLFPFWWMCIRRARLRGSEPSSLGAADAHSLGLPHGSGSTFDIRQLILPSLKHRSTFNFYHINI